MKIVHEVQETKQRWTAIFYSIICNFDEVMPY